MSLETRPPTHNRLLAALGREDYERIAPHLEPVELRNGEVLYHSVTGFFGDSLRFRSNESVVNELLRLKRRARASKEQVIVFFIDDNFGSSRPPPRRPSTSGPKLRAASRARGTGSTSPLAGWRTRP